VTSANEGKANILVVDDEEDNTQLIVRALASTASLMVQTASSARQALAMVFKTHFDVLVVDHRMPEMTGAKLIDHLAGLNYGAACIMVTAFPEDEEVIRAQKAGRVQCVITKPWQGDELVLAIQFALKMHSKKG